MSECKSKCGSEAVTRGYCRPHYEKARRNGLLKKVIRPVDCSSPGCDGDNYSKGLCCTHYDRMYRTGSTELAPKVKKRAHVPMPPLVAASVRRALIKETRRQRLAKRGIVPCDI